MAINSFHPATCAKSRDIFVGEAYHGQTFGRRIRRKVKIPRLSSKKLTILVFARDLVTNFANEDVTRRCAKIRTEKSVCTQRFIEGI